MAGLAVSDQVAALLTQRQQRLSLRSREGPMVPPETHTHTHTLLAQAA